MPASSRSAMPRSSAPAPIRSECWRITASGTSRSRGLADRRRRRRADRPRVRPDPAAHHRPDAADAHALHHGAARRSRQHGREIHRRLRRAAEPADPAAVRPVRVQSALSARAVSLRAGRAVRLLRVRAHAGLFAVRAEPHRHPRERAAHARGRRAGELAAGHLLHDLGGDRRHRRRLVGAGQRLCEPRRRSASIAPRPC